MFHMNIKTAHNKLLIADSNSIVRYGLKQLLPKSAYNSIEEVENCFDLMSKTNSIPYTHLIVDYFLEKGDVLKILQSIRNSNKNVSILLYSNSENNKLNFDRHITSNLINFYVDKDAPVTVLKKKLKEFSKFNVSDKIASEPNKIITNPFLRLSLRQQLVIKYLLKGLTINEIASKMNVKKNTVSTMKTISFYKLSVNSIVDLIHLSSQYKF